MSRRTAENYKRSIGKTYYRRTRRGGDSNGPLQTSVHGEWPRFTRCQTTTAANVQYTIAYQWRNQIYEV